MRAYILGLIFEAERKSTWLNWYYASMVLKSIDAFYFENNFLFRWIRKNALGLAHLGKNRFWTETKQSLVKKPCNTAVLLNFFTSLQTIFLVQNCYASQNSAFCVKNKKKTDGNTDVCRLFLTQLFAKRRILGLFFPKWASPSPLRFLLAAIFPSRSIFIQLRGQIASSASQISRQRTAPIFFALPLLCGCNPKAILWAQNIKNDLL